MLITRDALKIIRDLLYDQWSISTPSKSTISETGFVVAPRNKVMDGLAVTVSRENMRSRSFSTGSDPLRIIYDYHTITAWTQDKEQKDNMLKEIRRIIRDAKASPPGGIRDIELESGRPRSDLSERAPILAEAVRVKLIYQE